MTQTDLEVCREATAARCNVDPRGCDLPLDLGDWTLVELAAQGSLARIYRARPAECPPERPAAYAVKTLQPQWKDDARVVRMLAREVMVGRTVSHAHLVPILQAYLGRPPRFVVMPWLEGSTLQDRLAAGWQAELPEALWMARQAAEALQALHAAGWMHGDVKPANLFVSPENHVTLLDLGFARRRDETGSAVDRCVTGTCNYMAPELITSTLAADIRSDIYSLGGILFELLSGRVPFAGKDLADLAGQHRQARLPDLRRLAPHLPADVVRLVHAMLAKEPLRRPQTPDELIDRLAVLEIATFSERAWATTEAARHGS